MYISIDFHKQIKDLSKLTGVLMAQIIDKLIRHGLKYVELIDMDDGDKDDVSAS